MAKVDPSMSGTRKAAILMITLRPEVAAGILTNMDRESIERVSMEIARLNDVTKDQRDYVLEEFYQTNIAQKYIEQGGMSYAQRLLEATLPPDQAREIIDTLQQNIEMRPFYFLQKAEAGNLLTFIQDEHPQTISLILAHLSPQQASGVLSGLPPKKQIEVVKRIAKMERTSPEAVRMVEKGLEQRLASIVSQEFEQAGGVEKIAEILNIADRSTEKGILENLEEEDPDLVEQIRKLMFVFEDILLVNDKGIQAVLKEVDNEELSLALKNASEELKNKVYKNMSERAASLIKEEMEYMGPVRVSEVEAAQSRIVDIVRRLEDSGEVIITGRGGEEEIIV